MNSPDRDRSDLLDDLFPDAEAEGALHADALIRVIQREKQNRHRRQCLLATGFCLILISALATFALRYTPSRTSGQNAELAVAAPATAPQESSGSGLQAERVTDDGLIELLSDTGTPSAVVEWPDGRRALMLVVQTSSPE